MDNLDYMTAREVLRKVPRGCRIFLGSGSGAPLTLIDAMCKAGDHFVDHEVTGILTLGPAPWAEPGQESRFRHNALFIGPNVRSAVEAGRADYTPVFLSEIPELFRSGQMPIGVAFVSVAPPRDGMVSLGVSVDVVKAAIEAADMVIAEVNPRMPFTYGGALIPMSQIDYFVPGEHSLPELPRRSHSAETLRIGGHIAKLIEDGSTIQAGIGAIPDAALAMLSSKKDLGVHTEMMSDGYVDLIEAGVITNRYKATHQGKSITSFIMGSRRLYDFVNLREDLEVYPCDYTNDPFVIAQNDKMAAINTAIEIDLTGQVCADSIGNRFYSGIGGQVDFIRGAARSKGGKPIIALPSTAKNGAISRIKPRLQRGGGVVTTRGDVHYVVTEWGIASLHGKSIRERAMALIGIAHPKFRPWLMAEAKEHNYVYTDQAEPDVQFTVYPEQHERFVEDRQSRRLLVRPVRPTDEEALHDFFYRQSDESLYQRFFAYTRSVPRGTIQQICNVDYDTSLSLVACMGSYPQRIVGLTRYLKEDATGLAEVDFLVDDSLQHSGIGSLLRDRLIEIAREKGIRGFTADVLTTNGPMIQLMERIKGRHESTTSGDVRTLRVYFE